MAGMLIGWVSYIKKYPGNDEVAAFYSVALIGSVTEGRDDKIYEHAAQIAKEVLKRNPRHPGALHYLIHAHVYLAHRKVLQVHHHITVVSHILIGLCYVVQYILIVFLMFKLQQVAIAFYKSLH